jgi:endonuclease III
MTTERSRRLAHKVVTVLRKDYGRPSAHVTRPAMEEMLVGILAEGASERKGASALAAISRYFVDWNEVRVSAACEIASAMSELTDAVDKAALVRFVLQRIYDLSNEMTLDFLKERSPADAAKLIEGMPGFPEAALARATLLVLGHEAFPPTPRVMKVCRRLALLPDGHEPAALTHLIQGMVPKQGMFEFHWLLSEHAKNTCRPEEPSCDACGFRTDCRTGRRAAVAAKPARKRKKVSRKCN